MASTTTRRSYRTICSNQPNAGAGRRATVILLQFSENRMSKLIPFGPLRYREVAVYVLALSGRLEGFSKTKPWTRPRDHPELFGNHMQRLIRHRPVVAFVIENIVAKVIEEIDHESPP